MGQHSEALQATGVMVEGKDSEGSGLLTHAPGSWLPATRFLRSYPGAGSPAGRRVERCSDGLVRQQSTDQQTRSGLNQWSSCWVTLIACLLTAEHFFNFSSRPETGHGSDSGWAPRGEMNGAVQ
ncbi:unnamed protein product [Pleuronectes platessa]|uniref:Uncharacterized protein n=1 Tax=Pleuronectes platessa TaxID=8262 RepID=A0A9N7TYX0_PLEPL|nr:unnamed protein product [Pleuronectes platessa]